MGLNILLFTPKSFIFYRKGKIKTFLLGEEIDVDELIKTVDEVFSGKVAVAHFLPTPINTKEVLREFFDFLKPFKKYDLSKVEFIDIQGLVGFLSKSNLKEKELLEKVLQLIKSNYKILKKFSSIEFESDTGSKTQGKRIKRFNVFKDF